MRLEIEVFVPVAIEEAWQAHHDPILTPRWVRSDEWFADRCEIDARPSGVYRVRIRGNGTQASYEIKGTYVELRRPELSIKILDGDLHVRTEFSIRGGGTCVRQFIQSDAIFDPCAQKRCWQVVLDNFAAYLSSNRASRSAKPV